jgi:hypothetical protein
MRTNINYPKTNQFRDVISAINRKVTFVGLDENGEAIYDDTIPKPVITFKGTVKLHGSNASVCYNSKDGIWIQSRNEYSTLSENNTFLSNFGQFVFANENSFITLFEEISLFNKRINLSKYTITIYGEWAGKGIQKNVAIAQLEKAFYIFAIKISDINNEEVSFFVSPEGYSMPEVAIYNVHDFQTYSIDIDFNMPGLAQNQLIAITNEVEKECPIAKSLGVSGTGEGVVWTAEYKNAFYMFKVKGEKHSVTNVKKLAAIDVEKLKSIQAFIEYAVTENRFKQACENVIPDNVLDRKYLGELIKWTIKDVTEEEADTMQKNGLVLKDVNKYIAEKVKLMLFQSQKEQIDVD